MAHVISNGTQKPQLKEVFIVAGVRTPIASFQETFAPLSAAELAAAAITGAVNQAGLSKDQVEEVILGHACQAGCGQAPARQASKFAGLPDSTICTTINKLCASGLKSVLMASQGIQTGQCNVIVAGGMESMSNIPYTLNRCLKPYGNETLTCGIVDGLRDVYYNNQMGDCAEYVAKKYDLTREQQDDYATASYQKASAAWQSKLFDEEIVPVKVPQDKDLPDVVLAEDEEYKKVDFVKLRKIRTPFLKENGTVTAANAGGMADGAGALVLASAEAVSKHNLKPLARVLGYADGAMDPIEFPAAPSVAIPKLLKSTGVKKEDVALWEINEAFSVVPLVNMKILGLDPKKVNAHGGAVSLGHPLGMSGARILIHLVHVLKPGEIGVASACNGGGGASAILIEKL